MELFSKRPLAEAAAVFTLSSALVSAEDGSVKILFFAAALIAMICFAVAAKIRAALSAYRAHVIRCCAAVMCALAVSYAYMDVYAAGWESRCGEDVTLEGTVTDRVFSSTYGGSFIAKIDRVNGERVRIRALFETGFSCGLRVGDSFSASATLDVLESDGAFDEHAYYFPRGVLIAASIDEPDSLESLGQSKTFSSKIARLRRTLSSMTEVAMEEAGGDSGIAEALFVGERDGLDDGVYRDMRYAGASHLLAVSGLHLTVVIGTLSEILKKLTLPRPARAVTVVAASAFYMALTGFSASVTRAGIMMIICELSYFARREYDTVTSLFFTSACMIAVSPASAADMGFLLSVTAMLGCYVSGTFTRADASKIRTKILRVPAKILKYLVRMFAVSLCTLIFTLPVMWAATGRVSLLSPLASVLMSLPVTSILYLCPLIAVTFRLPLLRVPLANACAFLCRAVAGIASLLSRIRGATFYVGGAPGMAAVIAIALLLAAALVLSKRRALRALICAACVFGAIAVYSVVIRGGDVDIIYENSKKNDAVAVTDVGGGMLVVDVGDGSWGVISEAVEKAKESGAERVHALLLTHLHNRHIRTVGKLCRREYVDAIYLPVPETDAEAAVYDSIVDAAHSLGVDVRDYERGQRITVGDAAVDTVPRTMLHRSTHPVIAFALDVDGESVLYIGASAHESNVYGYLVDASSCADTVIFGAHGPVYKSSGAYAVPFDAHVIYANSDVAEMLVDENKTRDFDVYGE